MQSYAVPSAGLWAGVAAAPAAAAYNFFWGKTMVQTARVRPTPLDLDVSTRLAVARTRAAYDRTMLSWIRTATSLITFGFGVYKFFQIERKPELQKYLIGPEEFGLLLVAIGLLSLVLATWEFRNNIRQFGREYSEQRRSPTVALAALISVLGAAAFVIMLFRQ